MDKSQGVELLAGGERPGGGAGREGGREGELVGAEVQPPEPGEEGEGEERFAASGAGGDEGGEADQPGAAATC